jgi:pilus assembly protein Flp/PilA
MMNILERLVVTLIALRDRDEKGAAMVEYGLLVALIAVVVGAVLGPLGTAIAGMFTAVTAQV